MKKKSLIFILAVILGLSLVACSKTEDKESENDKKDVSDDTVVFSYEDNSEYITIPEDYIGIQVTGPVEVTDREIEQEIGYTKYMNMKSEEITEGAVKKGDKVNVTSVGTLEGASEPFESKEYDLTIGEAGFIDGYEDGLIGVNVGATVTLNLKFPDDYANKELGGKNAVFQVTVNYIHGKSYLPEWTDEFVQEITDGAQKNTVDYEAALRKQMQSERDKEVYYTQQSEIIRYLVDNSTVHKFPKGLVDSQYDSFLKQYQTENEQNYQYENFEDYVKEVEEYDSMEEFYDYLRECAEDAATELLAYQAVAVKEDITLTKLEYDNYLQAFAGSQGYTTAEKFEKDFMETYGKDDKDFLYKKFLNEKVLDFLQTNAEAVSIEPVLE